MERNIDGVCRQRLEIGQSIGLGMSPEDYEQLPPELRNLTAPGDPLGA